MMDALKIAIVCITLATAALLVVKERTGWLAPVVSWWQNRRTESSVDIDWLLSLKADLRASGLQLLASRKSGVIQGPERTTELVADPGVRYATRTTGERLDADPADARGHLHAAYRTRWTLVRARTELGRLGGWVHRPARAQRRHSRAAGSAPYIARHAAPIGVRAA